MSILGTGAYEESIDSGHGVVYTFSSAVELPTRKDKTWKKRTMVHDTSLGGSGRT
jgi:hypothetical protein